MQKQRFSLVLEDEPSDATGSAAGGKSKSKKDKVSKSSSKSASRRRDDGGAGGWESDEEERAAKRRKEDERYAREDASRLKRSGIDPDAEEEEDPAARAERERLEDLKERDEFAARMREREKERTKTKGIVEDTSAESLARRALASDPTALENAMPSLRDRSRQSYLGKREQQQLDLLRLEIAEDERDFRGVKLTRREREDLERKKELLRLAEERLAVDDGQEGYMMPDGELRFQLFVARSRMRGQSATRQVLSVAELACCLLP